MDPIPGMNTPVSAADDICGFVNEHSGLNLKATPVNEFTGSINFETTSLTLLEEQRFLHKTIRVFGTTDNPLFLARDVAEWLDYSKDPDKGYRTDRMLSSVDDDEKVKIKTPSQYEGVLKTNTVYSFLTENGLYEVLMLSRKPQAKPFKKKVKEILKSIRKNGAYIRNQENLIGTLVVPVKISSLDDGIYKVKGQSIIGGNNTTVQSSADDVLYLVSHDADTSSTTITKMQGKSITLYFIQQDGEYTTDRYITENWINEQNFASADSVKEYVSNIIEETVLDVLDEHIDAALERKLGGIDSKDLTNIFQGGN